MRHIVVPTDFSVTSYNALKLAKKIAQKTGVIIYLVHVKAHPIDKYPTADDPMGEDFNDTYFQADINPPVLKKKNDEEH